MYSVDKSRINILIIALVCLALSATDLTAASRVDTASGLHKITFGTDLGQVVVYVPDDTAAGDKITGTIEIQPVGSNNELANYYVDLDTVSIPVSSRVFELEVPKNMAGAVMKFSLKDAGRREVDTAFIPVLLSSSVMRRSGDPKPSDFECPVVGQSGRHLQVEGPFDGKFSTTQFSIGGKKAVLLAESPRKLAFRVPNNIVGTNEILLNENGVEVRAPFKSLQVVRIDQSGAVTVSEAPVETVPTVPTPTEPVTQEQKATDSKDDQVLTESDISDDKELLPTIQSMDFQGVEAEMGPIDPAQEKRMIIARQLNVSLNSSGGGNVLPKEQVETAEIETTNEESSEGVVETELPDTGIETSEPERALSAALPEARDSLVPSVDDEPVSIETLKLELIKAQLSTALGGAMGLADVSSAKNKKLGDFAQAPEGGKFTVQVASFKRQEDAVEFAQLLQNKGYKVYVMQTEITGKGVWNRVRVGEFETKNEASSYADQLIENEPIIKAFFVAESE